MQYLQPFLYFARKPRTGFINVLCACLCPFIPIAGVMILLGYRSQVSEALERDPDLKDHPDFEFGKIGAYVQSGIGPFLARLVYSVFAVPPAAAVAVATGIGTHALAPEPLLAIAVGFLAFMSLMLLGMTLLWPMEYHAQVTGKFSPLAEFRFALGFARLCWLPTLVAVLMFSMFSSIVSLLGLMLFYIGLYPAYVIQNMAEQHLMSQLYLLYLEEGGEPIRTFAEVEDDVPPRAVRAEDE